MTILEYLRRQQGIRQDELARIANISRHRLSLSERGLPALWQRELPRLLHALDVHGSILLIRPDEYELKKIEWLRGETPKF